MNLRGLPNFQYSSDDDATDQGTCCLLGCHKYAENDLQLRHGDYHAKRISQSIATVKVFWEQNVQL